jgi:hypothetical protein
VYTLTTDSNGNIYTIVDEKWHIVGFGNTVNLLGRANQIGGVASFVAILNDCDT